MRRMKRRAKRLLREFIIGTLEGLALFSVTVLPYFVYLFLSFKGVI